MSRDPRRGEIWRVRFDPAEGQEILKTRPAVVVNDDGIGRHGLRIVVPITGWDDKYTSLPWIVAVSDLPETGLVKPSAADSSQVKSVSVLRFTERLGVLREPLLADVVAGIVICIGWNGLSG